MRPAASDSRSLNACSAGRGRESGGEIEWSDGKSKMTFSAKHLTMTELEAGLEEFRLSPADEGVLELIVRRPRPEEREVLAEGELHPLEGLVGDCWRERGSSRTADG